MNAIKTENFKNLKKIELMSSKCVHNDFVHSFREYSKKIYQSAI